MSHDPLFDSAWLKWSQAMRHSQALEAEIEAFRADSRPHPGFASRAEYQPKRHGFSVRVEQIGPMPIRMRLLLGDAASNFRASLDHLAWALVIRGHTPPGSGKLTDKQEGSVYFPICHQRMAFNGEIRIPTNANSCPKLPGVRRADSAKVRAHQPYLHGVRNRPRHYLALLNNINNGDKHRTVQLIWAQPLGASVEVTNQRDCVVPTRTNRLTGDPLKVDAEIAFVHARKTGPNPEIEVETGVYAEPCVHHRISVETWLDQAKRSVAQLLWQFSDPPEIHD